MEKNMEYLLEFIFDLIFEVGVEASQNSKIPKYIRYPLIAVIILLFIAVIGLIFFVGAIAFKKNILVGIILIIIGLTMLIMSIIKFKNIYLTKKNENTK